MPVAIGVGNSPVFLNSGIGVSVPDAPTNLTATQDGADVDLAWTDNATNETEYRIYRSSDGASYSLIDTIAADSVTYTDIAPGSGIWYYKVAAANAAGEALSEAASVVVYLLRDEFTTDEAAPLASPRTAEPGPGDWIFIDTAGVSSIVSGKLRLAPVGTGGWGDPSAISGVAFPRSAGRALIGTIEAVGAHNINSFFGWNQDNTPSAFDQNPGGTVGIISSTQFRSSFSQIGIGTFQIIHSVTSLPSVHSLILRPLSGFLHVAKTGAEWRLFWVSSDFGITDLYPVISMAGQLTQTKDFDFMRVVDLPAPWNTEYGIATNRTVSPGDGATTTSEANALVEVTITAATGVTQELDVRRTDDDNRWIVRMDQAGGTIKLIERNAGVEIERASAAQTWTDATAYRVVAIQDGNTIRTFVANVAKNTYASATFNNTATGVKISHAASELITWPRVLSGAAAAALEAV